MPTCECKIIEKDGELYIKFCPLHEAAQDMYDALLTVMSYYHRDQYEAIVKAAIARAEGRQP